VPLRGAHDLVILAASSGAAGVAHQAGGAVGHVDPGGRRVAEQRLGTQVVADAGIYGQVRPARGHERGLGVQETGQTESARPDGWLAWRSPTVVVVRGVRWWGLVSSAAAPVLLVGGWTVAAGLQPGSFNAVAGTISSLAAEGAADRWVMTLALAGTGACYVMTGGVRRRSMGRAREPA
jgi:hypothetical protein